MFHPSYQILLCTLMVTVEINCFPICVCLINLIKMLSAKIVWSSTFKFASSIQVASFCQRCCPPPPESCCCPPKQSAPPLNEKTMPIVDKDNPIPPKKYSPFGRDQATRGEWTVARLDDLLNWGRKGKYASFWY